VTVAPTDPAPPPVRCIRKPGTRWTKHCTCGPCIELRRRMDKLRRVGRLVRADPELAWAYFTRMLDDGWSPAAIAEAYDIPVGGLESATAIHRAGGYRRLGATACAKLLRPPRRVPTRGLVPVVGPKRMLRALAAIGHSARQLARTRGITPSVLYRVQSGLQTQCSAEIAAVIASLYEELKDTIGTSSHGAARARRLGYAPPYAWTGVDITSPHVCLVAYPDADKPSETMEETRRRIRRRTEDRARRARKRAEKQPAAQERGATPPSGARVTPQRLLGAAPAIQPQNEGADRPARRPAPESR
jgi:hypothetical protein